MDALDGTWERAEREELLGDALFFNHEPGAAAHYQAAQGALMPLGVRFESSAEEERRMEAFQRIVTKRYAIGGDDRARPNHAGAAHPYYVPVNRQESELGKRLSTGDWWMDYRLAGRWFEAAKSLAARYPAEALTACDWSFDYYAKYYEQWLAHAPASRWDSDGSAETEEVSEFIKALPIGSPTVAPDWVRLLVAGNWRQSLAASQLDANAGEFQPLMDLLAEASAVAGD